MQGSRATRLLVCRSGKSLSDHTICQGDEVKCDGWVRMVNTELVMAEEITEIGPALGVFQLGNIRLGDWVILGWPGSLPEVINRAEFLRSMEFAGVHNGHKLYRRSDTQRMFCWFGEEPLRLYFGREADGRPYQSVQPGDWVVTDEQGGFRCMSKAQADLCLREAPQPAGNYPFLGC